MTDATTPFVSTPCHHTATSSAVNVAASIAFVNATTTLSTGFVTSASGTTPSKPATAGASVGLALRVTTYDFEPADAATSKRWRKVSTLGSAPSTNVRSVIQALRTGSSSPALSRPTTSYSSAPVSATFA